MAVGDDDRALMRPVVVVGVFVRFRLAEVVAVVAGAMPLP